LDESGQVVFTHSILGGENMDLLELQTCILSVAAIAANYTSILAERLSVQMMEAQQAVVA
jgi:hypothetical protein